MIILILSTNLFAVKSNCVSVQVTAQQLNIRSQPSLKGQILGKHMHGDEICIFREFGNWLQTSDGWISKKYVTKVPQNIHSNTLLFSEKNIATEKNNVFVALLIVQEIILAIALIGGLLLMAVWFIVKLILYIISFGMIDFNKVKQSSMQIYVIKDVWLTVKVLSQIFITILFFFAIFFSLLYYGINQMEIEESQKFEYINIAVIILDFLLVVFYIRTFLTFNQGYVIDIEHEFFSFPATDVENKFFDIFTLKRLRDYAKIKKVKFSEITDIYIDTKKVRRYNPKTKRYRQEPIYTLNIVGTFGSSNLEFSSRQKRDEVRGILIKAARDKSIRIKDRKVAEFS
jgi:hypothetical protein